MNTAPIILDIEASGFGRSGYPIEIGYALPDGQTWCSLIRPEPEWTHWDPGAEAVHHISQDLLLTRGRYVREVASLINQNLGKPPTPTAGAMITVGSVACLMRPI
jgi:hypothetical protein